MEWTPLETLSAAVERVAGPSAPEPAKMMAARGLAPLGPTDLISAIYQLSMISGAVGDAAKLTATKLPEKIVQAALGEASDARILDFFAQHLRGRGETLEKVLMNPATHDDTFVFMARTCDELQLEIIAKNEQRLLRSPDIIAALYLNKKTRMSTAQRAVELAVRNNVRVEGISTFDEIKKSIDESGAQAETVAATDDAAFSVLESELKDVSVPETRAAVDAAPPPAAEDGAEAVVPPGKEQAKTKLADLSISAKIRAATLGNSFVRGQLIRERNPQVAMACIRSPAVGENEVIAYSNNRALDDEIIRYISSQKQWLRLYSVKVNLCNNPKCPLAVSMKLIEHLQMRDLRALQRSKGIPTALANAVRNLISKKA